MSRDWTPREAYCADKFHFTQYGQHFCEMEITYKLGENEFTRPTKEEKELYVKYPYLSYTMVDLLGKLNTLGEVGTVLDASILQALEDYVKELCVNDNGKWNNLFPSKCQNATINKWYCGTLDRNFHYREYNDRLLVEFLDKVTVPEEIWNGLNAEKSLEEDYEK